MKDKILAVKKFHETFKIGYLNSPEADLGIEKNTLRHKLMKEENDEYFEAANNGDLVEGYGVKVDQEIHAEILKRNEQFTGAAYGGFVNPELTPITDSEGNINDIEVRYVNSFEYQMMKYAEDYGFLVKD